MNLNSSHEQILISPNTALMSGDLYIEGQKSKLRHVEDFRNFVFASQATVSTVLALVFDMPVPKFNEHGETFTTNVEAWKQYSADVIAFKSATDLENIELGKRIIQWCALATIVAQIEENPICNSSDFAVVKYIANHSGEALMVSLDSWNAYLLWLPKFERFQQSKMSEIEVADPGICPMPEATKIILPFPMHFVKNIDAEENLLIDLLEKCAMTDMIVVGGKVFLTRADKSFLIRLKDDFGLVSLFNEYETKSVEDVPRQANFRTNFGDRNCYVSAQFDENRYVFRFYP